MASTYTTTDQYEFRNKGWHLILIKAEMPPLCVRGVSDGAWLIQGLLFFFRTRELYTLSKMSHIIFLHLFTFRHSSLKCCQALTARTYSGYALGTSNIMAPR